MLTESELAVAEAKRNLAEAQRVLAEADRQVRAYRSMQQGRAAHCTSQSSPPINNEIP